ncbi:hypothetical protein BC833DRAFT_567346 [Globomyces pollinis-pini]|nr:hypothetical protein BC833DRAFT_567346 [Globomyces pollinis-pini]
MPVYHNVPVIVQILLDHKRVNLSQMINTHPRGLKYWYREISIILFKDVRVDKCAGNNYALFKHASNYEYPEIVNMPMKDERVDHEICISVEQFKWSKSKFRFRSDSPKLNLDLGSKCLN